MGQQLATPGVGSAAWRRAVHELGAPLDDSPAWSELFAALSTAEEVWQSRPRQA
jgi:hypothetical protein